MPNHQEISDLENTVQVSARRFEKSLYIVRTNSPGMVRGVYAGRYLAIHNEEDHIKNTGSCAVELWFLMCQTATLAAGNAIIDNGTPVGHITAGVLSPNLSCGIGYVRFKQPGDRVGHTNEAKAGRRQPAPLRHR